MRKRFGFVTYSLTIFCMVLGLLGSAPAQTVTGTISGMAVDPAGQVIPGATITLANERTGDTCHQLTNETGVFTFIAVQPGVYTIQVEQSGFRLFEPQGNVLPANEHLAVGTLMLSLGERSDTVTTTAERSAVQINSSEHSALLTSTQLEMISSRGRDVITKSGTREFHGTTYGYKRHEQFNANNFFNNVPGALRIYA